MSHRDNMRFIRSFKMKLRLLYWRLVGKTPILTPEMSGVKLPKKPKKKRTFPKVNTEKYKKSFQARHKKLKARYKKAKDNLFPLKPHEGNPCVCNYCRFKALSHMFIFSAFWGFIINWLLSGCTYSILGIGIQFTFFTMLAWGFAWWMLWHELPDLIRKYKK